MHDELRRLDEDLAAGRLDADSYRRRRDDLLAARTADPPRPGSVRPEPPGAVSPAGAGRDETGGEDARPATRGPDEAAGDEVAADEVGTDEVGTDEIGADEIGADELGAGGLAGATAPAPPEPVTDGAAGARDPFPPPFRWDGAPDPAGALPDSTQVVAGGRAAGEEPERTQVVPGAAGTPPGAADATQVVGRSRPRVPDPRLGPLRTAPPPERTQFVPGAALTRAGDLRAVPARRTVPPWVDERSVMPADARRPGREVFARRRGPSPAAVIGTAALVLVVLVVLALSFLLG